MKIIKYIFFILLFLIVSLLVLFFVNDKLNQTVMVTKYTFADEKIPSAFSNCKLMVISDLHNADFSEQIIKKVKKHNPDYVVITGDMVQLPDHDIDNTVKIAKALADMEIPLYAVSGNHDRQCGKYDEIIDILWANDVYMLENSSIRLEKDGESIALIGIKDPRHDEITDEKMRVIRGNIEYELSRRNLFSILLSHRADLYPGIKDTGVDLILSGHLHGGIVRLPFVGGIIGRNGKNSLFPDYEYGIFKEGNSATMIVSGGCDKNPDKRRYFMPSFEPMSGNTSVL